MVTIRRTRLGLAAVAAASLALLTCVGAPAGAQQVAGSGPDRVPARGVYQVSGADSRADWTAVANSGVDIHGHDPSTATVVATPEQARALRGQGFTLTPRGDFDQQLAERSHRQSSVARAGEFPVGDEGYHTYDEVTAEVRQAATDHADIASLSSIGNSAEGRALHLVKISDNAAADEDEPEVLFACNIHAREHLTTEMCLHIVQRFTDGYATDPTVRNFVDTREIYVIPTQNPDGAEFDIASGSYAGWRKNRQPNAGSSAVGTDLNRNFAYHWGCCGGSSGSPGSETYRGSAAASAPEIQAVQGFVDSRVVGGVQQITAHIDFHTFSELVLWPFGYTYDDVTDGMTQAEHDRFQSIGEQLAASNGYTPQQSSDLYITDGDSNDWMWGKHKILSYCFEMYPSGGGIDGFYPPDEDIAPQTARNDGAVDILLSNAG